MGESRIHCMLTLFLSRFRFCENEGIVRASLSDGVFRF
uniref:Uncharacterized protein n=1 Tax=Anguilla anguilla TaxID=7936 RepID=A0A0E9XPR3_ANGAN